MVNLEHPTHIHDKTADLPLARETNDHEEMLTPQMKTQWQFINVQRGKDEQQKLKKTKQKSCF